MLNNTITHFKRGRSTPKNERVWGLGVTRLGKILGFVVIIALTISLARNIGILLSADSRISEAQKRLGRNMAKAEELEREAKWVGSDFYKEKEAREKLGLEREGEVTVVLPSEEILRRLAPQGYVEEEMTVEPNWRRWVRLFF